MTMTDNKCDICHINPPIGVASTILPYSCAYCEECAKRRAQPEIVIATLYASPAAVNPDLVTFSHGEYITFKTWAERQKLHDGPTANGLPVDPKGTTPG